jgi:hypothetical protein
MPALRADSCAIPDILYSGAILNISPSPILQSNLQPEPALSFDASRNKTGTILYNISGSKRDDLFGIRIGLLIYSYFCIVYL